MKKGSASKVKDSLIETMDWKMTAGAYFPVPRKNRSGVRPIAKAKGMAVQDSPRKNPQITTKFMT
jgi:hypothetical protein